MLFKYVPSEKRILIPHESLEAEGRKLESVILSVLQILFGLASLKGILLPFKIKCVGILLKKSEDELWLYCPLSIRVYPINL